MPARPYPDPIEGLIPETIIITEETVETKDNRYVNLVNQNVPTDFIPPVELEVLLNNKSYILKCTHDGSRSPDYYYGDFDGQAPIFDQNPVVLRFTMDALINSGIWKIATLNSGTYTVSAKIPGAAPKILSFPKGRTIVSELSRLNKAFGTISKKKTIIGQLSDIADAAEAGKIGGGSGGAFMVHAIDSISENNRITLDKTWQEIYDALKTTSVYIIQENEEEMSVSTVHRIISAGYSNHEYFVSNEVSITYKIDSPDGYPWVRGES